MPNEIEMFERFMTQYRKALLYLDANDNVTLKASLNLNPLLTDWDNSELKQDYFINIFNNLFENIPNINEIILDTKLMGTTQQKRESIQLNYDQFIFVDTDISFSEYLLKYQLEGSYRLEGKYILIPQLVKLWDNSWDILVHNDYKNKEYGYQNIHDPQLTYNQPVNDVNIIPLPIIKFGCGMHTLYSKEFWDLVNIPESFGGYGSEDAYAMFASNIANQNGIPVVQYMLEGLYMSEDMVNRTPTFSGKVKNMFSKENSKDKSWQLMNEELIKFKNKII
jgi:hypothetical protein